MGVLQDLDHLLAKEQRDGNASEKGIHLLHRFAEGSRRAQAQNELLNGRLSEQTVPDPSTDGMIDK